MRLEPLRRRRSVGRRVAARRRITAPLDLVLVMERPSHRGKSDVIPRDFAPPEEADFQTFRAGRHRGVEQLGAVDELYLGEADDVVDRQKALDRDLCPRLFPGLALGAGAGRLVEFEVAGG